MRSISETRFNAVLMACEGSVGLRPGEVWPSESHSSDNCYFQALLPLRQEVFEMFVLAEKTAQLASPESCAYTDFAALLIAPTESITVIRPGLTRRRGHVFDGNPA